MQLGYELMQQQGRSRRGFCINSLVLACLYNQVNHTIIAKEIVQTKLPFLPVLTNEGYGNLAYSWSTRWRSHPGSETDPRSAGMREAWLTAGLTRRRSPSGTAKPPRAGREKRLIRGDKGNEDAIAPAIADGRHPRIPTVANTLTPMMRVVWINFSARIVAKQ